ncbi:hypothetical protein MO867_22560, partial [Microbulbifer sp. OS29]
ALDEDAGFIGALGARPNGLAVDYQLVTRVGSTEYQVRDTGAWAPTAALKSDMAHLDSQAILVNDDDLDLVEIGTAALIGDEIVRIDALDTSTNTLSLSRGCADTIPSTHSAGTLVWFYQDNAAADTTEYLDGEEVSGKLLTRTTNQTLSESAATANIVTIDQRQARP